MRNFLRLESLREKYFNTYEMKKMDMALISRDLSYFTSLYLFCVDSLMDIISEQIQMGIKGLSINFSNKIYVYVKGKISTRDPIKCSIDFAWNSFYNIPVKKMGS